VQARRELFQYVARHESEGQTGSAADEASTRTQRAELVTGKSPKKAQVSRM